MNKSGIVSKILIADDDIDLCTIEKLIIDSQPDMECCAVANNGIQALQLIEQTNPDVVLLDHTMPTLGGLGVLERMHKQNNGKPFVIVISANANNALMNESFTCGADLYLCKPFDIAECIKYIRMLSDSANGADCDCSTIVSTLVIECGINVKTIAFGYICQAVNHLTQSYNARPTFKQVYEKIAQRCNTDSHCVESAISHAIKTAEKCPTDTFLRLRTAANLDTEKSLSNSEFLMMTANELYFNRVK